MANKKLEVRHLTISFRTNNGAVRAVRDISFDLNEGETLAIAGESGSGKSVTTRAIMGILAGNAMVDGGEIIYDGRDLLKIPEEEFHTLRGHRLSMVFQDPLSALNPIMRIGKQLTEAMLLNNKERRADGKKRFEHLLRLLNAAMASAGVTDADVQIRTLKDFTKTATELDFSYHEAAEAATEALDCLDEMEEYLLKTDARGVHEASGRLKNALNRVHGDYLSCDQAVLKTMGHAVCQLANGYKSVEADRCAEKLRPEMQKLTGLLKGIGEAEAPDFFAIGYMMKAGQSVVPGKTPIAELNRTANAALKAGFLDRFLESAAKGLAWSSEQAAAARCAALKVLERQLPVFKAEPLVKKDCQAAAKAASEAVTAAIDPLELQKDNPSYVFRGSVEAAMARYFRAGINNPKEESRFARDTKKYNALVAKGKVAASVVPKNLIDAGAAHADLVTTVRELIAHYSAPVREQPDWSEKASALYECLKASAGDYAFRLSKGMARCRAIQLMKEVGISEPHKRFTQYPFEFSGGMRQRIVIAIALSANPDILICDEPTTALDVTIQAQILELINRLKRERKLSVIFITHDLGVVANMADRIAIMYAGKIVEYGTADDVFYDPRHPYTWALLSSMPSLESKDKLEAIPGTPPDMIIPPKGDAFAARNRYAMAIDFEEQPPMFRVSDTHWAATWLLHPDAPHVDPPAIVVDRIARMKQEQLEWAAAHPGEEDGQA